MSVLFAPQILRAQAFSDQLPGLLCRTFRGSFSDVPHFECDMSFRRHLDFIVPVVIVIGVIFVGDLGTMIVRWKSNAGVYVVHEPGRER